jgi:hypothetical protein
MVDMVILAFYDIRAAQRNAFLFFFLTLFLFVLYSIKKPILRYLLSRKIITIFLVTVWSVEIGEIAGLGPTRTR